MPSTFVPRPDRDLARGRRAAAAVKAAGGDALAQALANIDAAFNESSAHNSLKREVDFLILKGADHIEARIRFRPFARQLAHHSLDGAIAVIERAYRLQRQSHQIASAFGGGSPAALRRLRLLHVILRLMRAKKIGDVEFRAIVERVSEPHLRLVAAE